MAMPEYGSNGHGFDPFRASQILSGRYDDKKVDDTAERLDALSSYIDGIKNRANFRPAFYDISEVSRMMADIESRHYRRDDSREKAAAIVNELRYYRRQILSSFGISRLFGDSRIKSGTLDERIKKTIAGLESIGTDILDEGYIDEFYRLAHRSERRVQGLVKKGERVTAEKEIAVLRDAKEKTKTYLSKCLTSSLAATYRGQIEAWKVGGMDEDTARKMIHSNLTDPKVRPELISRDPFHDDRMRNSLSYDIVYRVYGSGTSDVSGSPILGAHRVYGFETPGIPSAALRTENQVKDGNTGQESWLSRALGAYNKTMKKYFSREYVSNVFTGTKEKWSSAMESASDGVRDRYEYLYHEIPRVKNVAPKTRREKSYLGTGLVLGGLALALGTALFTSLESKTITREYRKPAVVQHSEKPQPSQNIRFVEYTLDKGGTIWGAEKRALGEKLGRKPSNAEVLSATQRALDDNHISWDSARHLPVGYTFRSRV